MKNKLAFILVLIFLFSFFLHACGKKDKAISYRIVTPTNEEICELDERLGIILGMYWEDFNCESDDVYNILFSPFNLNYVSPEYNDEISTYISEPSDYLYGKYPKWNTIVFENDPKGVFEKIPDHIRDENGNVNEDLIFQTDGYFVIGHNKYDGAYIDWLVEGVWNGKINHTEMYIPRYNANCYYDNSFYYTPEYIEEGGGPVFKPEIEYIRPIENSKYEVRYEITHDFGVLVGTAVVAMKESNSGFRFWSIFSIDFD